VVVVGSVARGDFNRWSDVDTVVVAEGFADTLLERLAQLGPRPAGVEPAAWRPEEAKARLARADPMAVEAMDRGIWLVGSPSVLQEEY
jgi:predicted nucleotidyltransferase